MGWEVVPQKWLSSSLGRDQQLAITKVSPLDASLYGIQATLAMELSLLNATQIQIPVGKAYHTALQQLFCLFDYFGTTIISPLPVHSDTHVTNAILLLGDRLWMTITVRLGALFFG
jgi:hypothetical protein